MQILRAKTAFGVNLLLGARRAGAGDAVEPTNGRVVVVRARISHNVPVIVMRQIDILRVAAECELQDSHARKSEIVTELFDIRRDDAEIFGNNWQLAQRLANRRE